MWSGYVALTQEQCHSRSPARSRTGTEESNADPPVTSGAQVVKEGAEAASAGVVEANAQELPVDAELQKLFALAARCEENNKRIVGRWGRWFRPDWYDKDIIPAVEPAAVELVTATVGGMAEEEDQHGGEASPLVNKVCSDLEHEDNRRHSGHAGTGVRHGNDQDGEEGARRSLVRVVGDGKVVNKWGCVGTEPHSASARTQACNVATASSSNNGGGRVKIRSYTDDDVRGGGNGNGLVCNNLFNVGVGGRAAGGSDMVRSNMLDNSLLGIHVSDMQHSLRSGGSFSIGNGRLPTKLALTSPLHSRLGTIKEEDWEGGMVLGGSTGATCIGVRGVSVQENVRTSAGVEGGRSAGVGMDHSTSNVSTVVPSEDRAALRHVNGDDNTCDKAVCGGSGGCKSLGVATQGSPQTSSTQCSSPRQPAALVVSTSCPPSHPSSTSPSTSSSSSFLSVPSNSHHCARTSRWRLAGGTTAKCAASNCTVTTPQTPSGVVFTRDRCAVLSALTHYCAHPPAHTHAHTRLESMALHAVAEGDWEAAIDAYTQLLYLQPACVDVLLSRSLLNRVVKRYSEAVVDASRVLDALEQLSSDKETEKLRSTAYLYRGQARAEAAVSERAHRPYHALLNLRKALNDMELSVLSDSHNLTAIADQMRTLKLLQETQAQLSSSGHPFYELERWALKCGELLGCNWGWAVSSAG